MSETLTKAEAAAAAHKSEDTIQRWIKAGYLKARKQPGGRVIISRRDLMRALRGTPIQASAS